VPKRIFHGEVTVFIKKGPGRVCVTGTCGLPLFGGRRGGVLKRKQKVDPLRKGTVWIIASYRVQLAVWKRGLQERGSIMPAAALQYLAPEKTLTLLGEL